MLFRSPKIDRPKTITDRIARMKIRQQEQAAQMEAEKLAAANEKEEDNA